VCSFILTGLPQGCLRRSNLQHDVYAVAVLFDHPRDAFDLTGNPDRQSTSDAREPSS